ncbi:MAG: BON domain-containing protein, partial [Pirellulaceae bacterium]
GRSLEDQESVGTLEGDERFMRDNRRRHDFVGRQLDDLERYIGIVQGSIDAPSRSSVDGIRRRIDRSQSINRPLSPTGPTGNQMYYPRIELTGESREVLMGVSDSVESNALRTLARSSRMPGSSRLSVSVEGRTAILRGEVPSARARDLAAVLLSFEPGISSIRNEVSVNPELEPGPGSLQAWRDRPENQQRWVTLSEAESEGSETSRWESVSAASGTP